MHRFTDRGACGARYHKKLNVHLRDSPIVSSVCVIQRDISCRDNNSAANALSTHCVFCHNRIIR